MSGDSVVEEKGGNITKVESFSEGEISEPVVELSRFRRNSPEFQTLWCSFIVACTAGLYVTINGLRNNGSINSVVYAHNTDVSTAIGNALWVVSSFVGGATLNIIGPKYCMAMGAVAYPMYISGFWFYSSVGTDAAKYYIFMVSGVGAGCLFGFLWSVQNYLVTCYSKESEKGFYVACNWAIIKSGAVVGSLIGLCISRNQTSNSAQAHWYLYLIFIVINFVAIGSSFLLCDPKDVRRRDGSKIAVFKRRTLKEEFYELKSALAEKRILLMIIPLFVSETMLAPATTTGSFIFNVRSKALANLMYWLVQIPGAFLLHRVLDMKSKSRKFRAYLGLIITYVFTLAFFLGFYIMYGSWGGMKTFDRTLPAKDRPSIDWTELRFAGPFIWYLCSGILFGLFLNYRLWLISTLSNDPKKLGTYSGLVPAFQAAGIALGFGINSTSITFPNMYALWFVIYMVSLPCMIIVIRKYVLETNYFLEEDVFVPTEVYEQQKKLELSA